MGKIRSGRVDFSLVVSRQVMSLYNVLIHDVGQNSRVSSDHGIFGSKTEEVTLREDGMKWYKEHKDCLGEI